MDKKSVTIDWGTWDNPTSNKEETPQSNTNTDESKKFPSSWGEFQPDFPTDKGTTSESQANEETFEDWKYKDTSKYSFLGVTKNIELNPELYMLHYDNKKAIEDLDLDKLEALDEDGRYKIKSSPGSELSQIIGSIQKIGQEKGLDLSMFFLLKNCPEESSINIFKGKPKMNFIYVLQGDKSSGNFILDLSALGGPSQKVLDTNEGTLLLFEGWVPYRITRNLSDKNLLVIAGNLN